MRLNISLDPAWTDEVSPAVTGANLPQLLLHAEIEELNLDGLAGLTAATLARVGAECPRLRALSLKRCANLDDAALGALARRRPGSRSA